MIAKRQTTLGGNRRGHSAPSAFPNQPSRYRGEAALRVAVDPARPQRECLSCGLMVNVKIDGELGSHRVGSPRQGYWPCKGEDVGTP